VHSFRGYAVSKSKIIMAALLPFLFIQSSFAAQVIEASKDKRRLNRVVIVQSAQNPAKQNAQPIKSAGQKAAPRSVSTPAK